VVEVRSRGYLSKMISRWHLNVMMKRLMDSGMAFQMTGDECKKARWSIEIGLRCIINNNKLIIIIIIFVWSKYVEWLERC